jgi:hypothetical protein
MERNGENKCCNLARTSCWSEIATDCFHVLIWGNKKKETWYVYLSALTKEILYRDRKTVAEYISCTLLLPFTLPNS